MDFMIKVVYPKLLTVSQNQTRLVSWVFSQLGIMLCFFIHNLNQGWNFWIFHYSETQKFQVFQFEKNIIKFWCLFELKFCSLSWILSIFKPQTMSCLQMSYKRPSMTPKVPVFYCLMKNSNHKIFTKIFFHLFWPILTKLIDICWKSRKEKFW